MVDELLKSKNDFRITLQKIVLQSYAEFVEEGHIMFQIPCAPVSLLWNELQHIP